MKNYTEEIIKLASESKWQDIIKIANEALLDTDETALGFKKGVFNVILVPSIYVDYISLVKSIICNIPELVFYNFSYVKDFNDAIKGGLTFNTIKDKYCIAITKKKGVMDNMAKLNLPYNLYHSDYDLTELKHKKTKQTFEFNEAMIRGLIREKQINSLFED